MTNSLAAGSQAYLPTNTLPPVVLPFDPTGTLPLGILTVSNEKMAEQQVKDLARVEVRNRLGSVSGVVAPVVVGGKDRRVMIYLDPKKLEARNLSAVDVVQALDRSNMMVSLGTAYFGDHQVSLDTNMMVRAVDEGHHPRGQPTRQGHHLHGDAAARVGQNATLPHCHTPALAI